MGLWNWIADTLIIRSNVILSEEEENNNKYNNNNNSNQRFEQYVNSSTTQPTDSSSSSDLNVYYYAGSTILLQNISSAIVNGSVYNESMSISNNATIYVGSTSGSNTTYGNSSSGDAYVGDTYVGDGDTTGGSGEDHDDQEAYELVAFMLWYLFLVLCCIVPTCLAYRRRRLMDARMAAQHQASAHIHHLRLMHQLQLQQQHAQQQQQQHSSQLGPSSMFLLMSALQQHDAEHLISIRSTMFTERLKSTTMTVTDQDLKQNVASCKDMLAHVSKSKKSMDDSKEMDNNITKNVSQPQKQASCSEDDIDSGDQLEDVDLEEGVNMLLRIPKPSSRRHSRNDMTSNEGEYRFVPGVCAICLCPYESGDQVTWSSAGGINGAGCTHAYHTDCIVPWLAKKLCDSNESDGGNTCPVCRQEFARLSTADENEAMEAAFLASQQRFHRALSMANHQNYYQSQHRMTTAAPSSSPSQASSSNAAIMYGSAADDAITVQHANRQENSSGGRRRSRSLTHSSHASADIEERQSPHRGTAAGAHHSSITAPPSIYELGDDGQLIRLSISTSVATPRETIGQAATARSSSTSMSPIPAAAIFLRGAHQQDVRNRSTLPSPPSSSINHNRSANETAGELVSTRAAPSPAGARETSPRTGRRQNRLRRSSSQHRDLEQGGNNSSSNDATTSS